MGDARIRVLIVDDDPTILDLLSKALRPLGYSVFCASDGLRALDILGTQQVDLIIVDVHLPVMSGLQLIEHVRAQDAVVPIVIMTGLPELASAREALRFKVSDYLVKPFESLSTVQVAISRALGDRRDRLTAQELRSELDALEKQHEFLRRQAQEEIDLLQGRVAHLGLLARRGLEDVQALIDGLDQGVLITDCSGRVLKANRQLWRTLGLPETTVWKALDEAPSDALREALLAGRAACSAAGGRSTVHAAGPAGGCSCYLVDTRELPDEQGLTTGYLSIIRPFRIPLPQDGRRRARFDCAEAN